MPVLTCKSPSVRFTTSASMTHLRCRLCSAAASIPSKLALLCSKIWCSKNEMLLSCTQNPLSLLFNLCNDLTLFASTLFTFMPICRTQFFGMTISPVAQSMTVPDACWGLGFLSYKASCNHQPLQYRALQAAVL